MLSTITKYLPPFIRSAVDSSSPLSGSTSGSGASPIQAHRDDLSSAETGVVGTVADPTLPLDSDDENESSAVHTSAAFTPLKDSIPLFVPFVEPFRLGHTGGQVVWRIRPHLLSDTSVVTELHLLEQMQAINREGRCPTKDDFHRELCGEDLEQCPILTDDMIREHGDKPWMYVTFVSSLLETFLARFRVSHNTVNLTKLMASMHRLYLNGIDPFVDDQNIVDTRNNDNQRASDFFEMVLQYGDTCVASWYLSQQYLLDNLESDLQDPRASAAAKKDDDHHPIPNGDANHQQSAVASLVAAAAASVGPSEAGSGGSPTTSNTFKAGPPVLSRALYDEIVPCVSPQDQPTKALFDLATRRFAYMASNQREGRLILLDVHVTLFFMFWDRRRLDDDVTEAGRRATGLAGELEAIASRLRQAYTSAIAVPSVSVSSLSASSPLVHLTPAAPAGAPNGR